MSEFDSVDALAGEYVLGTLNGSEREAFEARLGTDTEAAMAVADWRARLAPLDGTDQPVEPPPAVWDAIKARIAAEAMPEGMFTMRDEGGEWETVKPGIAIKKLHFDEETGARSFLVRLDPDTSDEPHFHNNYDEEILMLSGEVTIGDVTLKAGDYHLARKGTGHGAAYSASGSMFFVREHIF